MTEPERPTIEELRRIDLFDELDERAAGALAGGRSDPQAAGRRDRRQGPRCLSRRVPAARRGRTGADLRGRPARAGHPPGGANLDGRDHGDDRDRLRRRAASGDRRPARGDRPGGLHAAGAHPALGAPPGDASRADRVGPRRGARAEPRTAGIARDDGSRARARAEQPGRRRPPRGRRSRRGARRARLDDRAVRGVRDRARPG